MTLTTDEVAAHILTLGEDTRAMRRFVLEELVTRTETYCSQERDLGLMRLDRVASVVAVMDEAMAYWDVENSHGPYTLSHYQRLAVDMHTYVIAQIPSLVLANLRGRDRG